MSCILKSKMRLFSQLKYHIFQVLSSAMNGIALPNKRIRTILMYKLVRLKRRQSCLCAHLSYVVDRQRASSPLLHCIVSIERILIICYMHGILHKSGSLRFIICTWYSREMALNTGLNKSFDNTYDCIEGIQGKKEESKSIVMLRFALR
jgi:hypothetical protein